MEIYEVAASLVAVLGALGSVVVVARSAINSPRRKALAEVEKQARLKELGLLDGGQSAELRALLEERDARIAELTEERDFLRKLLEQAERGGGTPGKGAS